MIKYYVWLQTALGQASVRGIKALKEYSTAENIYRLFKNNEKDIKHLSKKDLERLADTNLEKAEQIVNQCKENNIDIIFYGSKDYPYCLSVIDDAPIVIYVKGIMPDFDNTPTICIVGPRKVSDEGKKAAFSLSFRLAAAGFNVVSGGAVGTDTFVHAGALKADGKTAVCMGCGILNDYLPQNKKLRDAVSKSGCLISEYPPESPVSRYTFPVRNRIMSALSLGTVVIEAPLKSGALITARHSNEQGRDVFVIPGPLKNSNYEGSNELLRDGAKPLLDVSDIFSEYILRFPDKINIEKAFEKSPTEKKHKNFDKNIKKVENFQKKLPETLSKEAKIVYNYLDKQKFLPEDISVEGISNSKLLSILTELEMEFLIKAIPGGMYEKL